MKYFSLFLILSSFAFAQIERVSDIDLIAIDDVKTAYESGDFSEVRNQVVTLEESRAAGPRIDQARSLAAFALLRERKTTESLQAHLDIITKYPESTEIAMAHFGVARTLTELANTTNTLRDTNPQWIDAKNHYGEFLDRTFGSADRKTKSWRVYAYCTMEMWKDAEREAQEYIDTYDKTTDRMWPVVFYQLITAKQHVVPPDYDGAVSLLTQFRADVEMIDWRHVDTKRMNAWAESEIENLKGR